LWFLALLLVGCVCVTSGAPFQHDVGRPHDLDETPLPFLKADRLIAADRVAVGLFDAVTDDHSLYAVDVDRGTELARVDGVGRAVFAFDGTRILYAPDGRGELRSLDLMTHQQEQIWIDPQATIISELHIIGSLVRFIVQAANGIRVVILDVRTGNATTSPTLSGTNGARALVSDNGAFVLAPSLEKGFWWTDGDTWKAFDIDNSLNIVAVSDDRLIALKGPSALFQKRVSATAASKWDAAYEGTAPILARSVRFTGPLAIEWLEGAPFTSTVVHIRLDHAGIDRTDVSVRVPVGDANQLAWSRDRLFWTERRDGRLFLNSTIVDRQEIATATPAHSTPIDRPVDPETARALAWLKGQLSRPFTSREGRRGRLIDSYENGPGGGWTYDAAIAAITFTASQNATDAEELLAGLEQLQGSDGSWVFAYDADGAVARGNDRFVGSIAWVVMATNFYEWDTGDRRFAAMANRALTYLEQFRIDDATSLRFGAFSMGPSNPNVISTENNVDCYAAFAWRGRLDSNQHDIDVANRVAEVIRQLWVQDSSLGGGFFTVGTGAPTLYLDAQTWTMLALHGKISTDVLGNALTTAERRLAVTDARLGPVMNVLGFDETLPTAGAGKVWAEGTEGMVAALLSTGAVERARRYHTETMRYQRASGGIPYATENSAGWTTAPAVAATSWFVLNRLWPPRNPFDPDVEPWVAAYSGQEHLVP
jgi:hypothetical protein